jgi:non-ribosomal peptide synthetase component F
MHHIVSDGWSSGLLVRELAVLYEAFSSGQPSPLPELAVQYADYAVWQRQWLQGETLERQLDYWRARLLSAPPALELPTDRPRPAAHTSAGATLRATLPAELAGRLRGLSRASGVTLFMTLLAGWQTLLSRYSGQGEVVVGTPVANRDRLETEGLIGFFVNTLALRADLSDDPTFGELLGRVREECLGAYAHQAVPFEAVVQAVGTERELSRTPVFQVMFVMQNAPREQPSLAGLRLELMELERETAKFDLTLTVEEQSGGLHVELEYRTDLFDKETAERMLAHWRVLLEGAAAEPGRHVSELPLLSDEERRQLLVEWNETGREYTQEGACLHELFEAQAARTPERVAVECGDEWLSYGELNERANQLAHYLRRVGVGPETAVGVHLERGVEMVVAVLRVLKAGCAYQ